MSKKRIQQVDYISEAPDIEEPQLTSEQLDAISNLYLSAKSIQGADHMKLCSFYVVNREHCDCGLHDLRMAVLALEATRWTP